MYLRTTQRRRKDGSLARYVQLAHNRRVGGVTQAEVLLNLGREDQLDLEGLRRLAASITRFTDGDGGGVPLPGAPGEFDVTGSLELTRSGGHVGTGYAAFSLIISDVGVSREAARPLPDGPRVPFS